MNYLIFILITFTGCVSIPIKETVPVNPPTHEVKLEGGSVMVTIKAPPPDWHKVDHDCWLICVREKPNDFEYNQQCIEKCKIKKYT